MLQFHSFFYEFCLYWTIISATDLECNLASYIKCTDNSGGNWSKRSTLTYTELNIENELNTTNRNSNNINGANWIEETPSNRKHFDPIGWSIFRLKAKTENEQIKQSQWKKKSIFRNAFLAKLNMNFWLVALICVAIILRLLWFYDCCVFQ